VQTMTCFLDLDGVLADYYGGICRVFGLDPWPFKCRLGDWNFFTGKPLNQTNETVAPLMDRDFYANLDLLPDAKKIVERAEWAYRGDVYFLTSPWDTPGCFDGKLAWVKKHFPKYAKRMLVGSPKEACSHPGAILFDDSPANCQSFRESKFGGESFLVPRPWNEKWQQCSPENGAIHQGCAKLF